MTKISAKIVADSLHPNGVDRLTTMEVTFPRFILAELNTHRMLSKNSASSRAIPFNKMVKNVQENPFIPIAWQKEHSGMQGVEYIEDIETIKLLEEQHLEDLDIVIVSAKRNNLMGVTKQLANRKLEYYMWHTVLIRRTQYKIFYIMQNYES